MTDLVTGLMSPKAPLVFKPVGFLKLSDFFLLQCKNPKGDVPQVLETGCKPVLLSLVMHDSNILFVLFFARINYNILRVKLDLDISHILKP